MVMTHNTLSLTTFILVDILSGYAPGFFNHGFHPCHDTKKAFGKVILQ
jgi:hypothetical protein